MLDRGIQQGDNMFKQGTRAGLALAVALAGASCAVREEAALPSAAAGESLRIGLIADTQITTPEATSGYLFRTMRADALQNVAVRTTAQEALAVEHMQYMLDDLVARKPDLVVYLGDGANSGCLDEVDAFFGALQAVRERSAVPVFFAVGNHDYLATGNQASADQRALACGGKPHVDKATLVARTAAFNRQSWVQYASKAGVLGAYRDSLPAVTAVEGRGCAAPEAAQHADGCFYAAVLEFAKGGRRGAVILVDTSDYRDLGFNPALPGGPTWTEFRGLRGGVSYKPGGQNAWILAALGTPSTGDRFFASHYPTKDLKWGNLPSGRLGDLMSPAGLNVWLSAHTHEEDPHAPPRRGLYYSGWAGTGEQSPRFDEVNVGSTTDYHAHGAIVEVLDGQARKFAVAATGEPERKACKTWLDGLRLDDSYALPMAGDASVPARLGLTVAYRKPGYDDRKARANLDRLLATADGPAQREQWVRCLMDTAAKAESRARFWD